MYTLRKITGEGLQINFWLGNSYTLVTEENNPKRFKENYEMLHKDKPNSDSETYGFVIGEDLKSHPLFKKQFNYIMTESGRTFSNLSFK